MTVFYSILNIIFLAIQLLLAVYLLIPFFLLCFGGMRGRNEKKWKQRYPVIRDKNFDFAAIVTAHQDTRFLLPLVDSFLRQTYGNFIVYIVADDCDISDLHFNDERIRILKPAPALHAKIKSIKYAIGEFVREHDVLIVFDSDNLLHPGCLENLNEYFKRGFRTVQAHMLSKNTESIFEKMDSMGHTFNTFVERKAKMNLGLSSSITGSGTAIETELYKQVIYVKNTLGGFDKKLQADIIRLVPRLAYAEEAIVYDEKVADGDTLEKQRTRWIYTYFRYFSINLQLLFFGVRKMNFNIIFFAFTALRPPLFITIGLFACCTIANYFLYPVFAIVGAALLLLFFISFIVIVLTQSPNKGMLRVFLHVPVFVFHQLKALFKIKKASKEFLKTEHVKVVYIEDLLKNEPA